MKRAISVLVCVAAAVLGLLVSFLTAGVALFADGPFAERPAILVVSIVLFLLLGLAAGALAPFAWKAVALCLVVSAAPVVGFFGLDTLGQVPMLVLSIGFLLGDAAAGAFGAWLGARTRGRHAVR